MRFTPGRSGNPADMRVGTKHKTTAEVRALAQELFDRDYWRLKYERIHAGVENRKIEDTLLSYAPPDNVLVAAIGKTRPM